MEKSFIGCGAEFNRPKTVKSFLNQTDDLMSIFITDLVEISKKSDNLIEKEYLCWMKMVSAVWGSWEAFCDDLYSRVGAKWINNYLPLTFNGNEIGIQS